MEIIKITYTVCLPLLLGFIAKTVKDIKVNKDRHGKAYQDMCEKLNVTDSKIDNLSKIVSENYAMTSRYRIIRFYDEVMQQGYRSVSDDHWEQIIEDIQIYKAYCQANPDFKNHKGQKAMQGIENIYNTVIKAEENNVANKILQA